MLVRTLQYSVKYFTNVTFFSGLLEMHPVTANFYHLFKGVISF